MTITINGKDYPVTDKFKSEVFDQHPDLATCTYDNLIASRDWLLKLSTLRHNLDAPIPPGLAPNSMLTVSEQAQLDNITHVINVHNAVKFLQGRPHTDFGFDGVDQVHGNRITSECGCVRHIVFDHHKRHGPEELVHHSHAHPADRACEKHKQ